MRFCLFPALLFFIERALLGHYSLDALASMLISGSFVVTLLGIMGGFSVAFVGLMRGAKPKAQALLSQRYVLFSVVCGAFVSLSSLDGLMALFPNANENVRDLSRVYLQTLLPFMPLYFLAMAQSAILQAVGTSRRLFQITAALAIAQILLDVVLIPRLGVLGAAYASVIAISMQATLFTFMVLKSPRLRLHLCSFRGEKGLLQRLFSQALPYLSERVIQYGGFFAYVLLVSLLGSVAMGAQGALASLVTVSFLLVDWVSLNVRPLKSALTQGCLLLSCIAVLFIGLSQAFMQLFTSDPQMIQLGGECLQIAALAQPLTALAVVLTDALRGAGETKTAALVSIVGGVFVRFLAGYYFAFVLNLGLPGIWWGVVADWLVRVVILVPLILKRRSLLPTQ